MSLTDPDAIHNSNISNHFSALQYPQAIQQYLDKEKALGAIIGPFSDIPSDKFHCSPMLTQPKDIDKRRVILNLSYPKGHSLNDNVDKQSFDGKKFTLKFPTIDDICNEIRKNPNEVLMSKIDISRAFRNLRVDPGDAVKFGLSWNGQYYQDLSVAFGWIHGSASFQLVADVITHIMKRKGFKIFAYIDDFILINHKSKAKQAFDTLTDLLQELGLPMNNDKRTPPTRTLICLGICINLDTNTLSIDAEKIRAIYDQCINTLSRNSISRKHLQSLLGKLLYLHKCVKPARIFVSRILATFRQDCYKNKFRISTEMRQDLNWFIRFLHQFNGKAILVKNPIQQPHTLHIDASLTGLGGVWGNRVYSTPIYPFPTFEMGIVHWEMFNVLLALRVWGDHWKHSLVRFYCDNLAVVQVVQTSKTKDPFLAACIRNIWMITATLDIEIHIDHVKGINNTNADLLSRLYSDKNVNSYLLQNLKKNYQWFNIPLSFFHLYAFLRMSNIAPHSLKLFDPNKHFLRQDVIFAPPGAHLILKWCKTMQDNKSHHVVQIPQINNYWLCPVRALRTLLISRPLHDTDPLFANKHPPFNQVIDTVIRDALKQILANLKISPTGHGFHTFRRSGATLAFDNNIPLQNIMAHGLWRSPAVWTYLQNATQASSSIPCTFASIISSSF